MTFIMNKCLGKLTGCKSKVIFYTYDSILFDVHKDDEDTINTLLQEIQTNFNIHVHKGNTIKTLKEI